MVFEVDGFEKLKNLISAAVSFTKREPYKITDGSENKKIITFFFDLQDDSLSYGYTGIYCFASIITHVILNELH